MAVLFAGRIDLEGNSKPFDAFVLVGDEEPPWSNDFQSLSNAFATVPETVTNPSDQGNAAQALDKCRSLSAVGGPGLVRFLDHVPNRSEDHDDVRGSQDAPMASAKHRRQGSYRAWQGHG